MVDMVASDVGDDEMSALRAEIESMRAEFRADLRREYRLFGDSLGKEHVARLNSAESIHRVLKGVSRRIAELEGDDGPA